MAKACACIAGIAQLIESIATHDREGSIWPGGWKICEQGADIGSIAGKVDHVRVLAFCIL